MTDEEGKCRVLIKKIKELNKPQLILLLCLVAIIFMGIGYAGMEKVSANPAFCASCHNMRSHYDTYTTGNLLAKKHADAKVTCHDCHEPSLEQQTDEGIKYITGNYKDPMPKKDYSKDLCLKCHDYEKVKSKTASYGKENPHDSEHNDAQECSTCHSVHHESINQCNTCHGVSWSDKLDDSWQKRNK
ncbi:NapC/NirT family cytochrome c [Sporomusa acidovorans]|uniref:NapC/NirT cytochrome c N-terminal domain-containing protein n=1 Tax=Sporomusa acidovorans (strain ATCC 49682 / DSM 3132 / Mol) TaxID=1123286 RepID=A0ABZ3J1Z0_SPOA4|nr:NapC/NirT family cytochrome c [Sporomusa acidovorans]OZC23184.1 cytochrome c-type protein NapC [Sporomusa acidovorans DSM 3132]SDE97014.1 Tetraheme cytochrome c subunit of nitrate or TMAO reductase [Sporomusa acidovorans]